jgi:hypothetical protein
MLLFCPTIFLDRSQNYESNGTGFIIVDNKWICYEFGKFELDLNHSGIEKWMKNQSSIMGWIQPDDPAHLATPACSGPSQQARGLVLAWPTSHWAGPRVWQPWCVWGTHGCGAGSWCACTMQPTTSQWRWSGEKVGTPSLLALWLDRLTRSWGPARAGQWQRWEGAELTGGLKRSDGGNRWGGRWWLQQGPAWRGVDKECAMTWEWGWGTLGAGLTKERRSRAVLRRCSGAPVLPW